MSFSETIFLFFLALIIFGPKKLPEIARQVGKALNEFKRASNEFKAQIEQEISHLEVENKQTILPPSSPPEGATGRSRYAGAELEAATETPALAAAASEGASAAVDSSPNEGSREVSSEVSLVTPSETSAAAADPSEAVTVSDPVGAAAGAESHSADPHSSDPHSSEPHFSESHFSEPHA